MDLLCFVVMLPNLKLKKLGQTPPQWAAVLSHHITTCPTLKGQTLVNNKTAWLKVEMEMVA